jgi:hypothetical protein
MSIEPDTLRRMAKRAVLDLQGNVRKTTVLIGTREA